MVTAPFTTTNPRELEVLSCNDNFPVAPVTLAMVMVPEPDLTVLSAAKVTAPRFIALLVVATVPARVTGEAVAVRPFVKVLILELLLPNVTPPVFRNVVEVPEEIWLLAPVKFTA